MARHNPLAALPRGIDSSLWAEPKIMGLGTPNPSALVLYLFLATHPSSGYLPGVLRETPLSIAGRLRWTVRITRKLLTALEHAGLVHVDEPHCLVWLPEALRFNAPRRPADFAKWSAAWRLLPDGSALKARIATAWTAELSSRPLFAAAFARHCLGALPLSAAASAPAAPLARAKPPAKAPTKAPATAVAAKTEPKPYEAEFDHLWALYPKRSGSNPRPDAFRAFAKRRRDDKVPFAEIEAGLARYRAYCEGTQKIGSELVLQAATFFGPSRRWSEAWDLPAVVAIVAAPEALVTDPPFELVFAAYPRHDGKEDAWQTWQRIQPRPDTDMAARMVQSIAHWKAVPEWRRNQGADIPPLARWLRQTSWNRAFKNHQASDFTQITNLLGGIRQERVIEGAVERVERPVDAPSVTVPQTKPLHDPFVI